MPNSELDRFMNKVNKSDNGCWLWTGGTRGIGRYGHFWSNGKLMAAHRFSFETFMGPIPPNFSVCHSCDVTLCVNPDHLFLGTVKDNIHDALAKGRMLSPQGYGVPPWRASLTHCMNGHEYTEGNTLFRPANVTRKRTCRICRKEYERVRRLNAKRN